MSKLSLTCIVLIFIFSVAHTAAAEEFSVTEAGAEYMASTNRSAKLANKALPLIADIDAINSQAQKNGLTPKNYLSSTDFQKFKKTQGELHQLFALQNIESSLSKDLLTVERLYRGLMFYRKMQIQYAIKNGTSNGFDQWFEKQKLSPEMAANIKLLRYVNRITN